jgi:hypothetical protein
MLATAPPGLNTRTPVGSAVFPAASAGDVAAFLLPRTSVSKVTVTDAACAYCSGTVCLFPAVTFVAWTTVWFPATSTQPGWLSLTLYGPAAM